MGANLFAEQFASNSSLGDDGHSLPVFQSHTVEVISVPLVTTKNVPRIIHSLDASKATGHDGIPVVVLQRCCPERAPILAKLFNTCLADSVFPLHRGKWLPLSLFLRESVSILWLLITVLLLSSL